MRTRFRRGHAVAGSVEVWSRLVVDDGVEVAIEPGRAGLGPGGCA